MITNIILLIIYKILAFSCASLTFTRFEPVQFILGKLLKLEGKVYKLLYKLLTCPMCLSFWVSLVFTRDLFFASIVYVATTYLSYLTTRL